MERVKIESITPTRKGTGIMVGVNGRKYFAPNDCAEELTEYFNNGTILNIHTEETINQTTHQIYEVISRFSTLAHSL